MALNTEYDIVKAFEAIENELMASMIRNMKDHKLEEIEENKQWSMWQTEQLKSLEKYRRTNQEHFGSEFDKINRKIEALIRTARDEGEMDQEIEILKAIKKGFKARKVSPGAAAEFFKINDRKLDALIESVTNDMKKAETAVLRMANDQYRKIIYNAQVYANTGAGTYEKAVDMATKDFLAAGLNCVEYTNGARHTLKDYADMAIRTASKRAYLQGEGTKRQEWGISTVIVNKRGNPCPKCLPFCGKVLIDDVWSGGSKKDGNYPLMSYAIQCGLYHPRCRDVHSTYFPGISRSDDTWTKEELEAIGIKSKEEAKQQYAKRQEDKFERLSRFSLDEDNRQNYKRKATIWKNARFKTGNADSIEYAADKKAFSSRHFADVTDEWMSKAKPKEYVVKELEEIVLDGSKYTVDGVNVQHNHSVREREVAELLKEVFDKKVNLVPEVKGKVKGVQTSDYLIGNQRWDLKELSGSSKDAIRNAISKRKRQADYFIIDVTKSQLDISEAKIQAENVFRADNTKFVKGLMIIKGQEIIKILERI